MRRARHRRSRYFDPRLEPPHAKIAGIEVPGACRSSGSRNAVGRSSNDVVEAAPSCLRAGIDPVSHRAALHENDWMVSVFSCYRCGEPEDVASLRAARHHFERRGRDMVALVDNEMTVSGNEIGHLAFTHEALNQCYVDASGWLAAAAANGSDVR